MVGDPLPTNIISYFLDFSEAQINHTLSENHGNSAVPLMWTSSLMLDEM